MQKLYPFGNGSDMALQFLQRIALFPFFFFSFTDFSEESDLFFFFLLKEKE